ncbi:UNVERIFIED_CONTAM: hypothetical protein K2H54_057972 [Gekko kuhli]
MCDSLSLLLCKQVSFKMWNFSLSTAVNEEALVNRGALCVPWSSCLGTEELFSLRTNPSFRSIFVTASPASVTYFCSNAYPEQSCYFLYLSHVLVKLHISFLQ